MTYVQSNMILGPIDLNQQLRCVAFSCKLLEVFISGYPLSCRFCPGPLSNLLTISILARS